MIALACAGVAVGAGPDEIGGYASSHIIVRTRPGVRPTVRGGRPALDRPAAARGRPARFNTETAAVADAIARWKAASIEPVFAQGLANRQRAARLGLSRTYRIEVPAGTDTPAMVDELRRFGAVVELAELDGIGGVADTTPNDAAFGLQWGMRNTGQTIEGVAGSAGADINIAPAWDIISGAPDLVLAVIDAGFDQHVEIAGRFVAGWNTVLDNADISDGCNSHGTHVAGIAAATGNNGIGVAGVDWEGKIMPIRVLPNCSGFESELAEGICWAVDHGADVINMSLQFSNGTTTLYDAVQYAYACDVPMVAASGNQGAAELKFPARWPETIAVGAINNVGHRASFSNMGPNLDVMAPGEDIWSLKDTNLYFYRFGTSMATPHVAGLVMLMKQLNPDLHSAHLKAILQQTAVDLETPGFDEQTGFGLVDAHAAFLATQGAVRPDLDYDGLVGVNDLLLLLGAWGDCPDPCSPGCPCETVTCPEDFNADGTVAVDDLLLLLGLWSV